VKPVCIRNKVIGLFGGAKIAVNAAVQNERARPVFKDETIETDAVTSEKTAQTSFDRDVVTHCELHRTLNAEPDVASDSGKTDRPQSHALALALVLAF
jgi:hypothetical protein